jgi:RNA polymerase sigma factor (sigma-70 family)
LEKLADNYLMLGVKSGDLDKMALLFERYSSVLYGFVYRSINDAAISQDIVQTVFYRMIKYKESFTGQGEFRTWMYHIARNAIVDNYKKGNKIEYKDDITLIGDKIPSGSNLEKDLEKKQSKEMIHKALNYLSDDNKEIILLSKFQELSYKEIAEILDTNENNIKIKVHRALKQLKEIYLKIENGSTR